VDEILAGEGICIVGGASVESPSSLGCTPGIFGCSGLKGLLFIPSPAAGIPEENIQIESGWKKTQDEKAEQC
jgi:hypothetical protein